MSGSELRSINPPDKDQILIAGWMLHDVTWPQLIISKECCVPRVSAPLSLPSVSPQLVGCWGAPLFEPGGEPLSREGSITGGGERGEGEPRPDNQWRIFRREGVRYKI